MTSYMTDSREIIISSEHWFRHGRIDVFVVVVMDREISTDNNIWKATVKRRGGNASMCQIEIWDLGEKIDFPPMQERKVHRAGTVQQTERLSHVICTETRPRLRAMADTAGGPDEIHVKKPEPTIRGDLHDIRHLAECV
jgi:hypothetical protein